MSEKTIVEGEILRVSEVTDNPGGVPAAGDKFLTYGQNGLHANEWQKVKDQITSGLTKKITEVADGDRIVHKFEGYLNPDGTTNALDQAEIGKYISAAGGYTSILADALNFRPNAPLNIQADDEKVIYHGIWPAYEEPANDLFGVRHTDVAGNSLELQFFGNGIDVIGYPVPGGGKVEIFIDGASQGFYSFDQNPSDVIFSIKNLKAVTHTLKLVVTDDISTGGRRVYIKRFLIRQNRGLYIGSGKKHFGVHCGDFGIVGDGKKDETDNINQAIQFLSGDADTTFHGGQLFFPRGFYKIEGQLKNEPTYPNNQVQAFPIKIIGEGLNSTGMTSGIMRQNVNNLALPGSTVFGMYAETGEAKFITRPDGALTLEGITFLNRAGTIPMLYSMYTRLSVKECAFIDDHQTAMTDAIVLGGTVWGGAQTYPTNDGFQGYGTIIKDNHFLGVRRAVFGRVTANGVVVSDNSVWMGSGNANGAAIEFNHTDPKAASDPEHRVCGAMISGNLIELMHYKYGISLVNAMGVTCIGNNMYDSRSVTEAAYHLGGLSDFNTIIPSFTPVPASGFGAVKMVKNESSKLNNRIVWGEGIVGDVNDYNTLKHTWTGTQAQYDALSAKDPNTTYYITA